MDVSAPSRPASGPSAWWNQRLAPTAEEQRRAVLGLVAVGIGIVIVHAVIGLGRPINWDEAIHFTQVNPWRPAVFMEPHRTRGVSLLVAPIALFDPPMLVLRLYLAVAGAAATFAAFRTWVPVIGAAAPIAAGLYSAHWITVFYAVEILPNHPSALLAVAAAGLVARRVGDIAPVPSPWIFGGLLLLHALVRPPDAVTVGLGLGLLLIAVLRWEAWRWVVPAAAGGTLAIGSWWLEGFVRFGFGPLTTMRSASEYSVSDERINQLPLYLANLEHNLRCTGGCVERYLEAGGGWNLPPARTTAFLAAATILAVVGLLSSAGRRTAVLASVAAAAPLMLFYGFLGGATNQRYMIPAYALLLILPAVGARRAWIDAARVGVAGTLARGIAVILVGLLCWWQIGKTADRFASPATRERAEALGQRLADVADGEDCVVASRTTYPQIQYWSGCLAVRATTGRDGSLQPPLGELGSYIDLAARAREGYQVYAIAGTDPPEGSPLRDWSVVPEGAEPVDGYVVYRHEPDADAIPSPCPDDGADGERILARVLSSDC